MELHELNKAELALELEYRADLDKLRVKYTRRFKALLNPAGRPQSDEYIEYSLEQVERS